MATKQEPEELQCDVLIIGGGASGLNCFHAACHHLPSGAKVVVVHKERQWGGQWVDQYNFVKLHAPSPMFTAGEYPWDLKRAWHYRPNKGEILNYFDKCVKDCVETYGIKLVPLFEYTCTNLHVPEENAYATALVVPLAGGSLPSFRLRAKTVFNAIGSNIPILKPLRFNCDDTAVQSIAVKDMFTAEWDVKMFLESKEKPIYIVGSGKTALDAMYALTKEGEGHRMHCIAGHGTIFAMRDKFMPKNFGERNIYGKHMMHHVFNLADMYDGTNAPEILQKCLREGLMMSPMEGATSFMGGMSEKEEVEAVSNALGTKSHRAYLKDVIEKDGKVFLKLFNLNKKQMEDHEIERGSFVVNCTGHLSEVKVQPILSKDGRIVTPQLCAGTPGNSANVVTHLFYHNKLEDVWRSLPRQTWGPRGRQKRGLEFMFAQGITHGYLLLLIPNFQKISAGPEQIIPIHRLLPFLFTMKALVTKSFQRLQETMPMRYTDDDNELVNGKFEVIQVGKSDGNAALRSDVPS